MSKLIDAGISWIILGQVTPTSKKTEPKIEWIQEILEAADKVGVKVFLKNKLIRTIIKAYKEKGLEYVKPLFTPEGDFRQEFPRVK